MSQNDTSRCKHRGIKGINFIKPQGKPRGTCSLYSPRPAKFQRSGIKKYKEFSILILDNRLKALIYPRTDVHSIEILAAVRAGQLSEKVEQNGVAHLLEHMIFDGTEKFPTYKNLNNFFDQIAGGYNANTSHEFLSFGGTFVDEEAKNALMVLEQLLFHPLLKEEFLRKQKSIIKDELASLNDQNDHISYLASRKIRFKNGSILSLPLGGTIKSIERLTLSQVRGYHEHYFQPANINLAIVGNLRLNEMVKLVERSFGHRKNTSKIAHPTFTLDQFSAKMIKLIDRRSLKSYIRITFPGFRRKDPIKKRVALSYLCSLFSNRRDSLLFAKLREEMGIVYDIGTDFNIGFDIGVLGIVTSCPPSKSLIVIREILKATRHIKVNLFDRKFFNRVKEIDRKSVKMSFDTTDRIINWLADELVFRYPKILLPEDFIKLHKTITVSDICQVAKEIFNFDKINVTVLQQFKGKEKLAFEEKVNRMISEHE